MKRMYYWVYILECENGSFYTGYTPDLVRRYRQHLDGTGRAKYTKAFPPVRIAACWRIAGNRGLALRIEYLIKKQNRTVKDALVAVPDSLKNIVSEKLGFDECVYSFNPVLVQKTAENPDPDYLKSGDPFSDIPLT